MYYNVLLTPLVIVEVKKKNYYIFRERIKFENNKHATLGSDGR